MKKKYFCLKGHPLSGDNEYIAPNTGNRGCRICRRNYHREWLKRNNRGKISVPTEVQQANRSKYMFGGNREKAILRDGERCVRCGLTRQEHKEKYGRDITVDHIDGRGRNTDKELKNNSLSNLRTLCLSCHGKKDIIRRVARPVKTVRI